MSAPVLLRLTAEPETAERLADWLIAAGVTDGWDESMVDQVGGPAPYASRREQVRGRRPRVRFELQLDRAEALRLGRALADAFGRDGRVRVQAVEIFPLVGE